MAVLATWLNDSAGSNLMRHQLPSAPIVEEVEIVRVDKNQRWNGHILRQTVRYDSTAEITIDQSRSYIAPAHTDYFRSSVAIFLGKAICEACTPLQQKLKNEIRNL
jgi:hypothetical protein